LAHNCFSTGEEKMNLYGPIYSSKLKDVSGMTSIISEQYQLAEKVSVAIVFLESEELDI
jgi:tRNA G26 N,N-dimethylase Trm1